MIDQALIKDKFGQIWPSHVETLTRFLIECRRHFHGDLDLFLVLCVIGDRTLSRGKAPPDMTFHDFNNPTESWTPSEPINTRSIAHFSGIPRETVRRKVQDLIELGWIQRDVDGFLSATDKARIDLAPLTEFSIAYLVSMAKTFGQVES